MAIAQAEFNFLMSQFKEFDDLSLPIQLGPAPIQWTRKIKAASTHEFFLLDFYRGSFELSKYTVNKRYRQTIILLRYDSGGRHTNPDGLMMEGAHVHLYREGYNDRFAFPVSEISIDPTDEMDTVFRKILHFCNVTKFPVIEVLMF